MNDLLLHHAQAWPWMAALAVLGWLYSLKARNVTVVDCLWSWFFVVAWWSWQGAADDLRAQVSTVLLLLWAVRLSGYLWFRHHGQPEDRRYQAIRKRYQPFSYYSLPIVFLFQAGLAAVVALPLLAIARSSAPWGWLDSVGLVLLSAGWLIEAVADEQLRRFKAQPQNHDQVMQQGLWRLCRHPNYLGELLMSWGWYALALSSGGWWSLLGVLLMNWLLLRFSGVVLLEKTIHQRRPAYAHYVATTPALWPRWRR